MEARWIHTTRLMSDRLDGYAAEHAFAADERRLCQ